MQSLFCKTLVALIVVCSVSIGVVQAQPNVLQVGIARVDITPAGSVYMAGFAARKDPSEGTYRNIEATCLVFDNGTTRLALFSIDVCKLGTTQLADLRAAAEKAGIPPQHVMPNVSHTHCGPTLIGNQNAEYLPFFRERTCGLLQTAVDNLQEAKLEYTVGSCTMGVNRRQLNAEGKCTGMRPEPRKEIDPSVPILRVLGTDGSVRAVIFGYACHPTTMGGQEIGTDYPGYARDWIEAAYPGCTAVFLQGCGGDVKPRYSLPNGRFGYVLLEPKETVMEIGHELGRAVVTATCVPLTAIEGMQLGGLSELVSVPDKKTKGKFHEIEMGCLRIGDLYIFGSQCEVCSQIGMRIKRELVGTHIWTNGYTYWGGGYMPDAASYAEEGYEVSVSVLSPETEDIIVAKAHKYVEQLRDIK